MLLRFVAFYSKDYPQRVGRSASGTSKIKID